MQLEEIGFFRDFPYGLPSEKAIADHIGSTPREEQEDIILYLDAGISFIVAAGFSIDLLKKNRKIIVPLCIFTDGRQAWPSDLSYYLKNYQLFLPNGFIDHMKLNNWKIGNVDIGALKEGNLRDAEHR